VRFVPLEKSAATVEVLSRLIVCCHVLGAAKALSAIVVHVDVFGLYTLNFPAVLSNWNADFLSVNAVRLVLIPLNVGKYKIESMDRPLSMGYELFGLYHCDLAPRHNNAEIKKRDMYFMSIKLFSISFANSYHLESYRYMNLLVTYVSGLASVSPTDSVTKLSPSYAPCITVPVLLPYP
jgi:hypothetical protein